eukprot:1140519-Pelagomonas_calceolata.AAC.6
MPSHAFPVQTSKELINEQAHRAQILQLSSVAHACLLLAGITYTNYEVNSFAMKFNASDECVSQHSATLGVAINSMVRLSAGQQWVNQ